MGIIGCSARLYLDARRRGVSFSRVLTLGRQRLYLSERELQELTTRFGMSAPDGDGVDIRRFPFGGDATAFFEAFLGVEQLESLDHSAYEGATLLHDMNEPVPPELEQQFDAVIDAGSLEHIFNFPVAMANCMKMVRPGGTLFISTPANNHCGHGFYQFSPELFFRLLKDRNGFTLNRIALVTHPYPGAELSPRQHWYEVRDPAEVGGRVSLVTDVPVQMLVEATRTSVAPVLAELPQQSDYVSTWAGRAGPYAPIHASPTSELRRVAREVYDVLPSALQRMAVGHYQRRLVSTLRNRRFFRQIRT